ncbi:Ionotropic receptor 702 [Blattella germanica]|nr:Ionotropic receptor 702 [Blattella germanica]
MVLTKLSNIIHNFLLLNYTFRMINILFIFHQYEYNYINSFILKHVYLTVYRIKKMDTKRILFLLIFIPVVLMTPSDLMICLEEVISKQFLEGQVLVFSLPSIIPVSNLSSLNSIDSDFVNRFFENISEKTKWPLLISTDSQINDADIPEPHHGYVIFLFPDEDLISSLEIQIESLQTFSFSYNRRGKFIIVVLAEDVEDSQIISKEILNTVWSKDNIVNAIVILRAVDERNSHKDEELYDIYSLFPFRSEHCGESDSIDLLDQWTASEGFLKGNELMPEKVPKDLMGCVLNVVITLVPPLVIINETYTENEGNVIFDFDGINSVFTSFLSEAMNFSINLVKDISWNFLYGRLLDGKGVSIGANVMVPQMYSYADLSTPYVFTDVFVYAPCAKQNPQSGNVLNVFSTSVWLVSVAVLLLAAMLFFILQKNDMRLTSYNTYSSCVLNVWAVFLSLSVSSMPLDSYFRIFFFLVVCFCFAMNTIFQSFFTSYLIDPGYEKQLESIEDLNEKGLPFLFDEFLIFAEELSCTKLLSFFKHAQLCEPYEQCMKDMIKNQNSSFIQSKLKTEYFASCLGVKKMCTVWHYDVLGFVIAVSRGHPLLAKFNYFIRNCLEHGFLEIYWSHFIWKTLLLHYRNSNEENEYSYQAFALIHLQICFLFLATGYVLSIWMWCLECVCYKYVFQVRKVHTVTRC